MAGHQINKKHREEERATPTPPPEDFESERDKTIEEGRAMSKKVFKGKKGKMINAYQLLEELFE
jgi:hypothetical protein